MAASTSKKRTPAKKAAPKKAQPAPPPQAPVSVAGYRQAVGIDPNQLVQLPSGYWIRMRRPGIHEFLASGMLPDPLAEQVGEMIARGQRQTPQQRKAQENKFEQQMRDALTDVDAVADMLRSMQRVAASCWTEPLLAHHEQLVVVEGKDTWQVIPADERDTEKYLYTDEVPEEDIQFSFNYIVGGAGDVERFREDTRASVGALLRGDDVGVSA